MNQLLSAKMVPTTITFKFKPFSYAAYPEGVTELLIIFTRIIVNNILYIYEIHTKLDLYVVYLL